LAVPLNITCRPPQVLLGGHYRPAVIIVPGRARQHSSSGQLGSYLEIDLCVRRWGKFDVVRQAHRQARRLNSGLNLTACVSPFQYYDPSKRCTVLKESRTTQMTSPLSNDLTVANVERFQREDDELRRRPS